MCQWSPHLGRGMVVFHAGLVRAINTGGLQIGDTGSVSSSL